MRVGSSREFIPQSRSASLPRGTRFWRPRDGPIWASIGARRADIHAALLAERDDVLRSIFANPTVMHSSERGKQYVAIERLNVTTRSTRLLYQRRSPGIPGCVRTERVR
jgi:hypothetical protein